MDIRNSDKKPILYVIIPCYNEEQVLPISSKLFLEKINSLVSSGKVGDDSRIMFVNDGSKDATWNLIKEYAKEDEHFTGISLSRNRGHQNAVLAGLMEAMDYCDITISIDCDGQDDINAMDEMIEKYYQGYEVVYEVRSNREKDTFFKRFSAESYYRMLDKIGGVEIVYNHADYRLISKKVLKEFANFHEVNLFLRGLIPLVGFPSTSVFYERHERIAGESHYPLSKMLTLAFDGITSLSIKPIRLIICFGSLVTFMSFIGIIWAVIGFFNGSTVAGWASIICLICFFGGANILALGIIGEYVGKSYIEIKARPRYIISERTYEKKVSVEKE
ncbi:glycosyltransferase family 2 protein [Oribacterium sp. FC2011]|uniref:glycosyltransferase family 2 protein n=1 Tax=Oribacterium sp. FC2011 TaxID=1408311 RepID=UPI0004E145FB|nr:glycosyltransferase family 2 protein [Oribacterium sp. FC2011]